MDQTGYTFNWVNVRPVAGFLEQAKQQSSDLYDLVNRLNSYFQAGQCDKPDKPFSSATKFILEKKFLCDIGGSMDKEINSWRYSWPSEDDITSVFRYAGIERPEKWVDSRNCMRSTYDTLKTKLYKKFPRHAVLRLYLSVKFGSERAMQAREADNTATSEAVCVSQSSQRVTAPILDKTHRKSEQQNKIKVSGSQRKKSSLLGEGEAEVQVQTI